MTKQSDITYISGLLDNPTTISDRDDVSSWLEKYPYFTPLHYINAAKAHKHEPFAEHMLSTMHSHMGNWLQFCDFVDVAAGRKELRVDTEYTVDMEHTVEIDDSAITEGLAGLNSFIEAVEEAVEVEPAHHETESADSEDETIAHEITTEEIHHEEHKIEEEHKTEIPDNVVHMDEVIEEAVEIIEAAPTGTEELILPPVYTDDYFLQQGVKVDEDLPEMTENWKNDKKEEDEKSLMVMMSFAEWLSHFKSSSQKQKEESEEQRALKSMWQKEKLAAAIEEENDEIPEMVFEMAVNSITKEEDLASEPLAEIYIKQGKYDKAIDMYRKLSLRNPQKNAYFARKIEEILKGKQS